MDQKEEKNRVNRSEYIIGVFTGFLLAVLFLYLLPYLGKKLVTANYLIPFLPAKTVSPTPEQTVELDTIKKSVLPQKISLGITFGDVIVKMVQTGAIDKEKFLVLYQKRGQLSYETQKLIDEPADYELVISETNANLILNLLWPLGIANRTSVLEKGPMGTEYKDKVGSFASTGGWTLGKKDGGKLFNSLALIALSPQQEAEVAEIAQNIYRPCCGNSTYFPDCNHGAAMLGFIELAVSQGMPKNEIYKKALILNSYWFPQTYVELAIYYKTKKNISWSQVDPKEVLSLAYSSAQGYRAINKQLQADGLLPKVEGGGGCGV